MESSRACRDISEGELSFVRRPWIFGVWHNNSGWSHAQEILKLYKLSRREREVLGYHWPLPSRPHPSASSSLCSPQGPRHHEMRDFFPAWHGEQNQVLSPDSTCCTAWLTTPQTPELLDSLGTPHGNSLNVLVTIYRGNIQ